MSTVVTLRPFTRQDWQAFNGAESLSLNPEHGPYIGELNEVTVIVSGSPNPDEVVVQVFTGDFRCRQYSVPAALHIRTLQEAQSLLNILRLPTHSIPPGHGWVELN